MTSHPNLLSLCMHVCKPTPILVAQVSALCREHFHTTTSQTWGCLRHFKTGKGSHNIQFPERPVSLAHSPILYTMSDRILYIKFSLFNMYTPHSCSAPAYFYKHTIPIHRIQTLNGTQHIVVIISCPVPLLVLLHAVVYKKLRVYAYVY